MSEMLRIETEGQSTYAPDWDAVAALNKRIVALMDAIKPLQKDGTNTHFKYKFTSYEQVAANVRAALVKAGLGFSVGTGVMQSDGQTKIMPIEVCLTDTETGAMRVIRWYGEGQDGQDKGTAKALTAGVKYWMLRNLLISDQDDVDSDGDSAVTAKLEPAPAAKPSGWINDAETRTKFWAWTDDLGLTHAQVHEACGVESMKDYTGSKSEAVAAINAYIDKNLNGTEEG
jgi:hypothetical protein